MEKKSVNQWADEIIGDGKMRFFLENCANNGFWGDDLDLVMMTKTEANLMQKGYRKYMDADLFDRTEKDDDWYAEHPWIKKD